MELRISEMLEIGYFKFAKLLNEGVGLSNVVSSVTIMDIPHITSWLKGRELLISGMYLEESFNREFIDALLAVECAGIVTKEKFTHKLDPQLVDYCTAEDLPIIIVPDHCSWVDIMDPVNNAIIKEQYKSIEDTNRFHNILINAVIKENAIPTIAASIIKAIGLPAAILAKDGRVLATSGEDNWAATFAGIEIARKQKEPIAETSDGYLVSGIILKEGEASVFVYPITESGVLYGYIALAGRPGQSQLLAKEIVKVQFSGLLFALKISQQIEIENSTKYYHSLILNELLFSTQLDLMDTSKYSVALGKDLRESYRLLLLAPADHEDGDPAVDYLDWLKKELTDRHVYFGDWLLFTYQGKLIIFLPVVPGHPHPDTIATLAEILGQKNKDRPPFYFGVGREYPFAEIRTSYQEALQALNYARQNRRHHPVHYDDLGIIRFLSDNEGQLNTIFLAELRAKYITPLLAYDEANGTELYHTLGIYFDFNSSGVATCRELFIHKNTLRARFKTIERIIGAELTGDTLFHLQLAFKAQACLDGDATKT